MATDTTKVDVYMPWYVSDYLMDTADLDVAEHGAYSLLLMHMWKQGGTLPADHDRLARLARVPDPERWASIWQVIGDYFQPAGPGRITQKRLTKELDKARKKKTDARDSGSRGASKRWGKPAAEPEPDELQDGDPIGDPIGETMATPMANACRPQWRNDSSSPSESESDPPAESESDPARADPGQDPRARAIPDVALDAWPEPEAEEVRVHHGVVRARPAPPGRDPPGVRAQKLVDLFGKVRSEVAHAHGQGAVDWDRGPNDFAKARSFVDQLDDQGGAVTVAEVTQTMRLHLQWAIAQPDHRKHFARGFAFGAWIHRFPDLLEEVRDLRPAERTGKPCKFHAAGANTGRLPLKHLIDLACPECRHVHARASPRPASEPTSTGDLFARGP